MKLTEYRIGEIMTLVRRPVEVVAEEIYHEIGLRSFGNGVFHKPPVSGEELGSKRVFYINPGDLLFSNVFAWEGAVALASEQEQGKIGSHRFMTYTVDPRKADRRYLLYYFYGGPGLQAIRESSPGSAGRNRTLGIKNFENQRIRLPALEEQRRIADKLNVTLRRERVAHSAATDRAKVVFSAIDARESDIFQAGSTVGEVRLGDLAEINPRSERPKAGSTVAFVPMSAVNSITGTINDRIRVDSSDIGNGYKRFRRNDVIFARITPCMENGKAAIFCDEECEHGYGSTEFHVIRPSNALDGRLIHSYLRTRRFRDSAARHMTGTAGQQRVPANYLREVTLPMLRSVDDKERAIEKFEDLQATRLKFRALHLSQLSNFRLLSLAPSVRVAVAAG